MEKSDMDKEDYVDIRKVNGAVNEGYSLGMSGNIEAAVKAFKEAGELAGNSPDIHLFIGESIFGLFLMQKLNRKVADLAIKEYEKALSLGLEEAARLDGSEVKPWDVYVSLGRIYMHLKQYEDAQVMFQKALELGKPLDMDEADLFYLQEKYEKAIELYEALGKQYKEDPAKANEFSVCISNTGNCLRKLGRYEEALGKMKELLQMELIDPAGTWYVMAMIYAAKGDINEMLEALEKTIKLEPDYATWVKRQQVFIPYEGLEEFQKVLRSGPDEMPSMVFHIKQ